MTTQDKIKVTIDPTTGALSIDATNSGMTDAEIRDFLKTLATLSSADPEQAIEEKHKPGHVHVHPAGYVHSHAPGTLTHKH